MLGEGNEYGCANGLESHWVDVLDLAHGVEEDYDLFLEYVVGVAEYSTPQLASPAGEAWCLTAFELANGSADGGK